MRCYFEMYLERNARQNTTMVGVSFIVQRLFQTGLL